MKTWIDEYMILIEDCEKRESRLTDWDRGFVDSVRNQLEQGKPLSKTQCETLDSIWERVTANG